MQPNFIDDIQASQMDELTGNLKYLRKDAGFVASRVYGDNEILEIFFGVVGGKSQVFENVKTRFAAAIQSLGGESAAVLLAAFGLADEYTEIPLLKERRSKLAGQLNRSVDTVMNRENAAITELAVRLLNAYYSGAPLPANLPIPHGSFLIEQLVVETLIDQQCFVEHRQWRRVIALAGGLKEFRYHSNCKIRIIPLFGVEVRSEYVDGGSLHTFVFPKPLRRGATHTFAFREVLDESEIDKAYPESGVDFAGQVFQTPALLYRQSVRFVGKRPVDVWQYDKVTNIERPGKPNKRNRLEIAPDGIVTCDFAQQYGGFYSGVAWGW